VGARGGDTRRKGGRRVLHWEGADEEKEVEEELGEEGTSRFEKGVGYARRPSAFVGGEGLNVVNDFSEGGRFSLS